MTEEQKKNDATRYLVLRIDDEGDHYDDSEGSARQRAAEFAEANEGATYGVFQKIGTVTVERKVTWKGAKA